MAIPNQLVHKLWFTRAMTYPLVLFGLTGPDGYASFSKLITAAIVLGFFVGRPIPLGIAIVVIASSFGAKMFLQFLQSKTVTSTENVTAKIDVAAVLGRRDAKAGVDPA